MRSLKDMDERQKGKFLDKMAKLISKNIPTDSVFVFLVCSEHDSPPEVGLLTNAQTPGLIDMLRGEAHKIEQDWIESN